MTDAPESPATPEPESPQPWEKQLEAAGQEPPARRDGFDGPRKRTFLKALARGETLKGAAKAASVSPRTVYNHQASDPQFAEACLAAAKVTAPTIELAAFERAVTGVEEDVISYGKHVGTRVKRSDALLQTLLKGSNPEKYGPQAGFRRARPKATKKKWRERESARLREEIRAELEAERAPSEARAQEMRERLMKRFMRLREQMVRDKGYSLHPETDTLVPPGWALVPAGNSSVACASRELREAGGGEAAQ